MKKNFPPFVLSLIFLFMPLSNVYSDERIELPVAEFEFVETFSGKDADFVRQKLGEPEEIMKRENESGTVEFWIYKNIVKIGSSDKTYKYTQIGIINNYIETLGNTNRSPK